MDDINKTMIDMLSAVREEFIKNKEELKFSIRRDIVAVELRDIVTQNPDYYSLKEAIDQYCKKLINLDKE